MEVSYEQGVQMGSRPTLEGSRGIYTLGKRKEERGGKLLNKSVLLPWGRSTARIYEMLHIQQ